MTINTNQIKMNNPATITSARDVMYSWVKGDERKSFTRTGMLRYDRLDAFLWDESHSRLPNTEYLIGESLIGEVWNIAARVYRPECAIIVVPEAPIDCYVGNVYRRMFLEEVKRVTLFKNRLPNIACKHIVETTAIGFNLATQRVVDSATPYESFKPDEPLFFRNTWSYLMEKAAMYFDKAGRARTKYIDHLKSACECVESADSIQEFIGDKASIATLRDDIDVVYKAAKARIVLSGD